MLSNTARGNEMMEEARKRRDELEYLVNRTMTENVDYMVMENNRFCLLKAGAEKLCDVYGYAIQYELIQASSTNIDECAMYIVKAILKDIQSDQLVAEGLGLASSQESPYVQVRSIDVANTVLKIAKKRALVDAVLSAVGGSFLFTQDLDDQKDTEFFYNKDKNSDCGSQGNRSKNKNNSQSYHKNEGTGKSNHRDYGNQNKQGDNKNAGATDSQINYIEKLVSKRKISVEQVRMELEKRFGLVDYHSLNKQQASDFIQGLMEMQPWAS